MAQHPKTAPFANPCEFDGQQRLFLMWYGEYRGQVYIWAANFDDAFEELVEYLDYQNDCDIFVTITEDDLKDAAYTLGIAWQASWPDYNDPRFAKVLEHAETDLTVIGHTTLKKCKGQYVFRQFWGGDEITDADVLEDASRNSMQACWGHSFLVGDTVWLPVAEALEIAGDEDDAGVWIVTDVDGDSLEVDRKHPNTKYRKTLGRSILQADMFVPYDPQKHTLSQQPRLQPQPKRTEQQRMSDFFFGKQKPPSGSGGGFMGLDSFNRKRRR